MRLKSKQEEVFEVEKEVARRSVTVKNIVDDTDLNAPVPLPAVDSPTLSKVIEYCKYHHEAERESFSDDDKAAWDKAFVEVRPGPRAQSRRFPRSRRRFPRSRRLPSSQVGDGMLFDLILAANYMDIKSLLDLACKRVAAEIKDKTPDEIRSRFGIENDLTPEEEEQVKRENTWCEER